MSNVLENLVRKGYSEKQAKRVWLDVQEAIKESILTGEDKIVLRGVGTITSEKKSKEEVEMFGKINVFQERLKLKFRQSNYLSEEYRTSYSESKVKRSRLFDAIQNLK